MAAVRQDNPIIPWCPLAEGWQSLLVKGTWSKGGGRWNSGLHEPLSLLC